MIRSANRLTVTVRRTAVVLCGLGMAGLAVCQDMQTYYTVRHPEKFDIDWTGFYEYANERTSKVRDRLRNHTGLAYGDQLKQHLDLYLPDEPVADAPVFLFLHGGGFQEGDRLHYGFIADSFSRHGIITAVASYRLATDGNRYPAQVEDVRDAVAWIWRNIGRYGGNRDAIFVGGHSAGGILAADVGVDRRWMRPAGIPARALQGIVSVSGVYDFRVTRPGYVDAYAPTAELRGQASPITRLEDPVANAVVAAGAVEESILPSSRAFAARLSDEGVHAELLILPGENHRDTVVSLADASDPLFRAVLEMVNRARADR